MENSISSSENSSILKTAGRFGALGIAYVVIAWATIEFIQKKAFVSIFESHTPYHYQILIGAGAGTAFALVQRMLLFNWNRWKTMQISAVRGSTGLFRSPATILLISVIVGVTEEILFRAAIQPLIGIFYASVLFTAVHLNLGGESGARSDSRMAALSILIVFAASLLMGLLFESFGLLTSVAAHMIYDAIVLFSYRSLVRAELPAGETA